MKGFLKSVLFAILILKLSVHWLESEIAQTISHSFYFLFLSSVMILL